MKNKNGVPKLWLPEAPATWIDCNIQPLRTRPTIANVCTCQQSSSLERPIYIIGLVQRQNIWKQVCSLGHQLYGGIGNKTQPWKKMRINIKRIALLREKLDSVGEGCMGWPGGAPVGGCLFVLPHIDHIILQMQILRYNLVLSLIWQMRNVWISVQILARPNALSADIKDASGWEDESDRDLPHLQGVLRSANGTKMYIMSQKRKCALAFEDLKFWLSAMIIEGKKNLPSRWEEGGVGWHRERLSENSQPKLGSIKPGSGLGTAGDTVVNKTDNPCLWIIWCGGVEIFF